MFTIKIDTSDIDKLIRRMSSQGKQIRYATAVALTRTGYDVRAGLRQESEAVFDRPTKFTLDAWAVRPATPTSLEATVYAKPAQAKYLALQVTGGTREPGRRGIKLPGNIQLNAFGNIPRGLTDRLKAAAQNGTLGPALARRLGARGKGRKGAAPVQLFYGQPTGKGWERAPVGIWQRVPGKLIPLIVFEDTPAKYRKRLDLDRIGNRIVGQRFAAHFSRAWSEAQATAR